MQQLLSPLQHSNALAEVYRLYLYRGVLIATKDSELMDVGSGLVSKCPCD